jgi:hypothetical protein
MASHGARPIHTYSCHLVPLPEKLAESDLVARTFARGGALRFMTHSEGLLLCASHGKNSALISVRFSPPSYSGSPRPNVIRATVIRQIWDVAEQLRRNKVLNSV